MELVRIDPALDELIHEGASLGRLRAALRAAPAALHPFGLAALRFWRTARRSGPTALGCQRTAVGVAGAALRCKWN